MVLTAAKMYSGIRGMLCAIALTTKMEEAIFWIVMVPLLSPQLAKSTVTRHLLMTWLFDCAAMYRTSVRHFNSSVVRLQAAYVACASCGFLRLAFIDPLLERQAQRTGRLSLFRYFIFSLARQ